MSMSRKKCCVPGCLDSGSSHRTMHLFPNPAKDIERFNQWVFWIGGDIIGLDNEDIYKHRSVCHSHFEEKFCCHFNRLSNIAVPTLNLPGYSTIPKFTFSERRPMRQLQNCPTTIVSSPIPSTSASLSGLQRHSPAVAVEVITSVDNNETRNNSLLKENIDPVTQPLPARITAVKFDKAIHKKKGAVIKKNLIATPEGQKLHQKLLKVRIKLSKCNKMKKQAANLKAAKNIASNPALVATMEKLPSTAKLLMFLQCREAKKQNKGRRFLLQEKILALSIFKLSPKAYRFLRRILILPAPQTLSKLISQAYMEPGINNKIFSQLKGAADKMKTEHKLCILLFDEMYLKANLSYNERKDKAIGFVKKKRNKILNYKCHVFIFQTKNY